MLSEVITEEERDMKEEFAWQGISRDIYGNNVQLKGRSGYIGSYPRFADANMSFDERLGSIRCEMTRKVLKEILDFILSEYIPGVNDKRNIEFVEQDLVNYPNIFLYGLAELFIISNHLQRLYIIDSLIAGKIKRLEYL